MWYITLDEIQEKEYMQLIHSKFFYSLKLLIQKIRSLSHFLYSSQYAAT